MTVTTMSTSLLRHQQGNHLGNIGGDRFTNTRGSRYSVQRGTLKLMRLHKTKVIRGFTLALARRHQDEGEADSYVNNGRWNFQA